MNRRLLLGLLPIFGVAGILLSLPLLSLLPGFPGELFRKILGVVSTPFCLEISLTLLSIIALLISNHIRGKQDGDEYVVMSIPDDPLPPKSLKP